MTCRPGASFHFVAGQRLPFVLLRLVAAVPGRRRPVAPGHPSALPLDSGGPFPSGCLRWCAQRLTCFRQWPAARPPGGVLCCAPPPAPPRVHTSAPVLFGRPPPWVHLRLGYSNRPRDPERGRAVAQGGSGRTVCPQCAAQWRSRKVSAAGNTFVRTATGRFNFVTPSHNFLQLGIPQQNCGVSCWPRPLHPPPSHSPCPMSPGPWSGPVCPAKEVGLLVEPQAQNVLQRALVVGLGAQQELDRGAVVGVQEVGEDHHEGLRQVRVAPGHLGQLQQDRLREGTGVYGVWSTRGTAQERQRGAEQNMECAAAWT